MNPCDAMQTLLLFSKAASCTTELAAHAPNRCMTADVVLVAHLSSTYMLT